MFCFLKSLTIGNRYPSTHLKIKKYLFFLTILTNFCLQTSFGNYYDKFNSINTIKNKLNTLND